MTLALITYPAKLPEMLLTTRDLNNYLHYIWGRYFSDIPRVNEVEIAYCQPWKSRLGLIRMSEDQTRSFIGINALLQHERMPEYILITTIAHELTHYAHGFGSPLPRLYAHPHADNVVDRELEKRGLGEEVRLCDEWIDKEWFVFYDIERNTGWSGIPKNLAGARKLRNSRIQRTASVASASV